MSHNHVWKFNAHASQKDYTMALKRITLILENLYMIVGNSKGDPNSEAYTESFIIFNGRVPCAGEHFYVPLTVPKKGEYFSCDTLGYPYDSLVKACLVVLYEYLGDDIEIYNDGTFYNWGHGIRIAGNIPVKFTSIRDVPIKLKSMEDFCESKFRP